MGVTKAQIIDYFKTIVQEETKLPIDKIDINSTFHELGLDSISSMYLLEEVESHYSISFTPLYFWDYPTIYSLANQLYKENFL